MSLEGLKEFSLYINKASFDKSSQTMRWAAVASDTDKDLYEQQMSLELYQDFIRRAESGEKPPAMWCTETWCGGLPYVSLSHYPDYAGVPGDTEALYIDGNALKGKGTFRNTPLGKACFDAICKDLYAEKSETENRVRISIGFLDYAHYHGSLLFERKTITDRCPLCEAGVGEIRYVKGLLLHLALTRVPVNQRTSISPDDLLEELAMTTAKDDAASIVGEELAIEVDDNAVKIAKSQAVVELSDKEEAVDEEKDEEEEGKDKEVSKSEVVDLPVETEIEASEEEAPEEISLSVINQKLDQLLEARSQQEHILDEAVETFRAAFDSAYALEADASTRLKALQPAFDNFAGVIRSTFEDYTMSTTEEAPDPKVVSRAEFQDALQSVNDKLALLLAKSDKPAAASPETPAAPPRRSFNPGALALQASLETPKGNSLEALAKRSVGL